MNLFGRVAEPEPSVLDVQQASGQDASESLAGQHIENMVQFWEYISKPSYLNLTDLSVIVKELGSGFLKPEEIEEVKYLNREAQLLKSANLPEASKSVIEESIQTCLLSRSRDGVYVRLLATLNILKKIDTAQNKPNRPILGGA